MSEEERKAVSTAVADYTEKLLAQAVSKGFASYDTAPGGLQVLVAPRDFQSIFKTQGDCQILFEALKAEIWKDTNGVGEALAKGVA